MARESGSKKRRRHIVPSGRGRGTKGGGPERDQEETNGARGRTHRERGHVTPEGRPESGKCPRGAGEVTEQQHGPVQRRSQGASGKRRTGVKSARLERQTNRQRGTVRSETTDSRGPGDRRGQYGGERQNSAKGKTPSLLVEGESGAPARKGTTADRKQNKD